MAKLLDLQQKKGRFATNMDTVPGGGNPFSKPVSEKKAEPKKEEVKKAVEEEPKKEEKTEVKPVAKEEKTVKQPEKTPEKVVTVSASEVKEKPEKKHRGRPRILPQKLNEKGEDLTSTNVLLEPELRDFVIFSCEQLGRISKSAFMRMLVHNAYEKNFEEFRQWKKLKEKSSYSL